MGLCKNILFWITLILVVVGAIIWGLVAVNPNYNLVERFIGNEMIKRAIYGAVGVSGILVLIIALWEAQKGNC